MEKEKEIYTAYELEKDESPRRAIAPKSLRAGIKSKGENHEVADVADIHDSEKVSNHPKTDNPENPESGDSPEAPAVSDDKDSEEISPEQREIEAMIAEIGAPKVLQLIRGNRNAAIEQIMSEIEENTDRSLHTGISVGTRPRSIFDLANLA